MSNTKNGSKGTATIEALGYDAAYRGQIEDQRYWHLSDNRTGGAHFGEAWLYSTGAGVKVGIVDEGVNYRHVDLAAAYDETLDYDPRDAQSTMDAAPDSSTQRHGTNVAGLIVGDMANAIGTVGGAPDASLTASFLRYGEAFNMAELAGIIAHQAHVDISNNSWGFTSAFADNFKNSNFATTRDALVMAAAEGRDGLGTVFVFAAGNGKAMSNGVSVADDTNFHSFTSSRYTIAVGAHDINGKPGFFSTPGATVLLTAPGMSVRTTNGGNPGDTAYTSVTGTSFAAPIVSAAVALMLAENPLLGIRDVQEILALSATSRTGGVTAENGATFFNGGGLMFDREGGFGMLDAAAAVNLARTWTGQATAANEQHLAMSFAPPVTPNPSFAAFEAELLSPQGRGFSIDRVELEVDLYDRGLKALSINLISPTGTRIALTEVMNAAGARTTLKFDFGSVAQWGEDPFGVWRVEFSHSVAPTTFMIFEANLHVYGDWDTLEDTHFITSSFAELVALDGSRAILRDEDGGSDTLNFAAARAPAFIDLGGDEPNSIDGIAIYLASDFENVIGTTLADTLFGSAAVNRLVGDYGADVIDGRAGDDILDGGFGDDVLTGGDGSDSIVGGEGWDTFVLAGGFGDYIISRDGTVYWVTDAAGAMDSLGGIEIIRGDGWAIDITGHPEAAITSGAPQVIAVTAAAGVVLSDEGVLEIRRGASAGREAVATIAATDPNLIAGDRLSFTLVDGDGQAYLGPFSLLTLGNEATIVRAEDVAAGDYGFNLRVVDLHGNATLQPLWVTVSLADHAPSGRTTQSVSFEQGTTEAPIDITPLVDPEGDLLTYTVVSLPGEGLVRLGNGVLSLNQVLTAADLALLTYSVGDDATSGGALGLQASDGVSTTGLTVNLDVQAAESKTMTGTAAADRLDGAGGSDEVLGLAGADTLLGGSGRDTLFGGSENDTLDGGAGVDVMDGGLGDDIFYVDARQDRVIEAAAGGVDHVYASVHYALSDDVEMLSLLGGRTLSATGNALDNTLTGNNVANVLDGGAGADVMVGRLGDDTYVVDDAGDQVVETAGAGVDTVMSAVDYNLGVNVEHLTLTGTGDVDATGNRDDNRIAGNSGDNVIDGQGGNDRLTGGGGADAFVFNMKLDAANNLDTITDFSVADDVFHLDDAIFARLGAVGPLNPKAFKVGAPADANDRLLYDSATGALSYDLDGSGAKAAVQFAQLNSGLALTAQDFLLV